MKTIVVYKSKTGYTKKYAEWIAEELNCDIKEDASLSDIIEYDTVIFGSGMYVGGMNGVKLISKNLDRLSGKKLILFAVGSNPGKDKDIVPFWNRIFTEEQQKNIGLFYLRGGFDYTKLGFKDKILMDMLKKHLQKLENPDEDERGLLAAYDTPVDFTDRANIAPLVEYARK